jgi:predicted metal-dependent TIM-barrel fold hydrolase
MTAWLDPHIHMISRVTDDYHRMAPSAGHVSACGPAA